MNMGPMERDRDTILGLGFQEESPVTDSGPGLDDVEEPLVFGDEELTPDDAAVEELPLAELDSFDDAIKIYLRDIQRTPLLNADSEKELAARVEKGDKGHMTAIVQKV